MATFTYKRDAETRAYKQNVKTRTYEHDVQRQLAAQEDDRRLRLPVVLDVGDVHADVLDDEAVDEGAQPHVRPAASQVQRCGGTGASVF